MSNVHKLEQAGLAIRIRPSRAGLWGVDLHGEGWDGNWLVDHRTVLMEVEFGCFYRL